MTRDHRHIWRLAIGTARPWEPADTLVTMWAGGVVGLMEASRLIRNDDRWVSAEILRPDLPPAGRKQRRPR